MVDNGGWRGFLKRFKPAVQGYEGLSIGSFVAVVVVVGGLFMI